MKLIEKITRFFRLLGDSPSRNDLKFRLRNFLWPLLYPIATIYRKYFLNDLKIIVIAGSLGKTTTTMVIKRLLNKEVSETFESNAFGSLAVKLLKARNHQETLVMEVGIAKRGDMKKYARMIRPDLVVITSVTAEHAENIGPVEDIITEKSEILKGPVLPTAVFYNGDDPNVKKMIRDFAGIKISYGFDPGHQYVCTGYTLDWPEKTVVTIQTDDEFHEYDIKLFGRQMVYCFLAGVAIARYLGFNHKEISQRTRLIRPVYGRMEVVKLADGRVMIRDDFKSSPESIRMLFDFAGEIPGKRVILIMGSISHVVENQRQVYRQTGLLSGKKAHVVFYVASRDQEQAMASALEKSGMLSGNIFRTKGNWQKIPELYFPLMSPDDVIVVKGQRRQKLERLSLMIQGKKVSCTIRNCELKYIYCRDCSRLS